MAQPLKQWLGVASAAFTNLKTNDPIRMAAATAFFSFFALPPITIILSQVYGQFLDGQDQRMSWQLFRELAGLFGDSGARQLQNISQNIQERPTGQLQTGLSIALLLLASTTLFAIIKNSLNQLWNVKPAPNRRVWHALIDRAVAFGMIIFSGLLFTGSLAVHRLLSPLNENLGRTIWLPSIGQHIWSILVLTIWFAMVFKYLPDIRIHWHAVGVGALVTGILVEVGEQILDKLLIQSSVSSLYGTSGAIILILLFVFYAALIFYYGASFTRQYAQQINKAARPGSHTVAYTIEEVGKNREDAD